MKKWIKYIILVLLFISFFLILYGVLTKKMVDFDNNIYSLVTMNKSDFVTKIYKFITFFGSTAFMVMLAIFFLVLFYRNKKGGVIAVGLIISTIINNVIKPIVKRQRPLELMMVEENTFSFPSGHTMAAVTMYVLLIYVVWKSNFAKWIKITLTVFLIILTLAIGLSRIYLGAHFASDVIASIIVSSIWLIIYLSFIEKRKFI